MYKIEIDDIEIKNRRYFKTNIWNIDILFKINFIKDRAIIKYLEPYNFLEVDLIKKSTAIKLLIIFIDNFRIYQFNQ